MIKKLVGLVIIVAILGGVVAFGSLNTKNSNSTSAIKQSNVVATTTSNQANNSGKNTPTTQKSKTKISPAEAQKIANKYILQPGAVAGTPKLIKQNTQMVYLVPVIMKGKQVGEIYIDAQTGKNLGGAGGAP